MDTIDKKNSEGRSIDVEDNAICIIKMTGGIEGTMEVNWCCYGNEDNSTILYCEKGVMKVFSDPEYDIILEMKDGSSTYYKAGGISTNARQLNSGVIDAFIKSLIENKPPLISGEEGYKALSIVCACVESSRLGKWVKLQAEAKRWE